MRRSSVKRKWIRELWLNRPWVYIPELVRLMKLCPYRKEHEYFLPWLRQTLSACWIVEWKN